MPCWAWAESAFAALMALAAYRCARIFAIDISDDKLALARELGATDTMNSANVDAPRRCDARSQQTDFCVESGGSVATIELGFSLIRKGGGRLLFASHPPEGELIRLAPHDLISGKQIAGSSECIASQTAMFRASPKRCASAMYRWESY